MPEIAESELRTLREAAGRVTTLESERDAAVTRAETAESERDTAVSERDEARNTIAESERATTVTRILTDACEAAGVLPDEFQLAGIRSHAVNADDGTLDEAATRAAFDKDLAKLAEAAGKGRPRGLGGKVRTNTSEASAEDLDAELDQLAEATFGPVPNIKEA